MVRCPTGRRRACNGMAKRQRQAAGCICHSQQSAHMADNIVQPPAPAPALLAHGAEALSRVTVDAYNAELRTSEGFVGDRASKRAFQAILDDWRERMRKMGEDPLGEQPSEEISKKQLDKVLMEGDAEAAGMVHSAIEEFAQEFAAVIRRFLRLKEWKEVERIAVGGGLRQSRIGELAIGRTSVALKARGHAVELRPIHTPRSCRPDRQRTPGSLVDSCRPRQHPGGRYRRQQHSRRHRRISCEEKSRSLRCHRASPGTLAALRRRAEAGRCRQSTHRVSG